MTEHPNDRLFRDTSRILISALTFPGRIFRLPLGEVSTITGLATIASSLLSDNTTFYTPDDGLRVYISRTGALFTDVSKAGYYFYPEVSNEVVNQITGVSVGTDEQTKQAATLFIGCKLHEQVTLQLSGPGIPDEDEIRVNHVPLKFWEARKQAIQYPPGWDVYLVDGPDIVGPPWTTIIEVNDHKP